MPSVVHAPLINTPSFMFKDRPGEQLASAFTAVNGRTSPPSPRNLNGLNGMNGDSTHVRPPARQTAGQPQERRVPSPNRDDWKSVQTVPENGQQNRQRSSPTYSDQGQSPTSPGKRKRSSSSEEDRPYHSPGESVPSRRRLDSYASVARSDSPITVAQVQQLAMDHQQSRTLPPMDRADSPWPPSRDGPNGYPDPQNRDPRPMEPPQDNMHPNSGPPSQLNGIDPNGPERSSTTEITRAGVQVDPKKRKRVSCDASKK